MDPETSLALAMGKLLEARESAATWNRAMEMSIQRAQELEAENAQLRARNAELEGQVNRLGNILERMGEIVDEFSNLFKSFSGC